MDRIDKKVRKLLKQDFGGNVAPNEREAVKQIVDEMMSNYSITMSGYIDEANAALRKLNDLAKQIESEADARFAEMGIKPDGRYVAGTIKNRVSHENSLKLPTSIYETSAD